MPSFLDRLRQKPEAVRTRYFFISVGTSFLFVMAIWVFSLKESIEVFSKNDNVMNNVQSRFRDITKDSPDSLDALLKTGSTLREEGRGLGEMMRNSPQVKASESSSDVTKTETPSSEFLEGVVSSESPTTKPLPSAEGITPEASSTENQESKP